MNWKMALVAPTLVVAGLAGSAFALPGCGGDDCTRADDKMAECMTTMASSTATTSGGSQTTEACVDGAHLCHSNCINKFTCTQINGNDPAYISCMTDCQGL